MKIRLFLTFSILAAGTLSADPITPDERRKLVRDLEKTRYELLKAVEGLSPEQAKFKPNPFRWSVLECLEHIAISEQALFGLITEQVLATEAKPDAEPGIDENEISQRVADRSRRFQAPERVRPTGRYESLAQGLDEFLDVRHKSLEYARHTEADLHSHLMASPLGEIDAYEWLFFLSGHARRHTRQIEELKGHENFPKE